MTLRRKVVLIIGLLFLGLMLVLYATAQTILLNNFVALEESASRQNMQRVLNALADSFNTLRPLAADQAWRAEIADLLAAGDGEISGDLFAARDLSVIVLADADGQALYAGGYDRYTRQPAEAPRALLEYLRIDDTLLADSSEDPLQTGYLMLPEGPLLVLAAPVPAEDGSLPPVGTLIWGRYLDSLEIQRLAEITRLPIRLQPYYDPRLPDRYVAVRDLLSAGAPIVTRALDEHRIASYALLEDVHGNPIVILEVEQTRDIYRQGQSVILAQAGIILIFGLLATLGSLFLLDREVLGRLLRLTNRIREIGHRGDVSTRVAVEGRDELAELATSINAMLGSLEQSQAELAQAQEQLARSARLAAAGEIAAGVAHQINNPLTSIVAEVHLLLNRQDLDDDLREGVQAIKEATYRAGSIVEQMLNLTRSVPLDMVEIDVNASVENAITLVKAQVEPYVSRLVIELAPDLPPITASGRHLEDVVWINLLLNARDAVRDTPSGQIRVRTAYNRAERMVEVTIEDNGTGISPEDLPHIFTPFFTTKPHGTGLGLAICHDVVQRHGGIMKVESRLGAGTRFTVKLPVSAPAGREPAGLAAQPGAGPESR